MNLTSLSEADLAMAAATPFTFDEYCHGAWLCQFRKLLCFGGKDVKQISFSQCCLVQALAMDMDSGGNHGLRGRCCDKVLMVVVIPR